MAKSSRSVKKSNGTMAPRYCANPPVVKPALPEGISNERARLILTNKTKWVSGTTLHYYFFNKATDGETVEYTDGSQRFISWKGTAAQQEVVRKAFGIWKNTGIGITFKEVKFREEAEIRIGFMEDDGAWSYVGRDILTIPINERTMNFGWNIAVADRHNGIDTAVHEIGHTLGLQHEHQNPFAGIVWDEPAVYAALGAPPNNWPKETTYNNIIKKLDKQLVNGSSWDADSIMHYPFGPGLIKKPEEFNTTGINPPGGLSAQDVKYAVSFYPKLDSQQVIVLKELVSYDIPKGTVDQQQFLFKPTHTRYYNIQTFGKLDTVMVLSEKVPGKELQYLSGDDNSGTDKNALIRIKLFRGKAYVIQLKIYYKKANSKVALMIS